MTEKVIQQKARFSEALYQRGRNVTIKHANAHSAINYDPIAGAYPDPHEEQKYIIGVVPFSEQGKAQLAARSDGRFFVDPAYEAYSFEASSYVPFVGDVIVFDGRPLTVVFVDATVVDDVTIHYQVGLRNG